MDQKFPARTGIAAFLLLVAMSAYWLATSPAATGTENIRTDDGPGCTVNPTPTISTSTYINDAAIAPADRANNDPGSAPGLPSLYPSIISTGSDAPETCVLTKIEITFAVSSERPDDLDILAVSPSGGRSLLLSDAGGSKAINNVQYTFTQFGATFPDETAPPTGTYVPANYPGLASTEPNGFDNFPGVSGLASYEANFNALNSFPFSGEWKLYVVDDETGGISSLPSGWTLKFTFMCNPPPMICTPTPTPSPSETPSPGETPTPSPTPSPSTRFDYDGDQKADVSARRSNGHWYVLRSTGGFVHLPTVAAGNMIAPADFNGDRHTEIGEYRQSNGRWFWVDILGGQSVQLIFGDPEDLPVPADYDGDGKADIAVFKPSTGVWTRINSSNGAYAGVSFGRVGDRPTIGDFDGDHSADVAVFRPSTGMWYRLNSSNGSFMAVQFGLEGDKVVPADYDGDGQTDVAIWRPGDGVWHIWRSTMGYYGLQFGLPDDIPAPADYDGDGLADITVFRPSTGIWYRLNSSDGSIYSVQWGQNGDIPTAAAYVN